MSSWSSDDLVMIAESESLFVCPFREDGTTYGPPVRVWPLVVKGEIYVRAANGPRSHWYMAAMSQKAGRIQVGGKDHDVRFAPAADDVASAIDAAYEDKYKASSAVKTMQGAGPRSAAVRISPC